MRATIIRPDGTRIEAEGTPEEVAKLAPQPAPVAVPFIVHCSCGMTTGWCAVHGYSRWTGPIIYGTVSVYGVTDSCKLADVVTETITNTNNVNRC